MTISYLVQYTKTIQDIEIQIYREEQKKNTDVTWMAFNETQAQLDKLQKGALNQRPVSTRQSILAKKNSHQKDKVHSIAKMSFFSYFVKGLLIYPKRRLASKNNKKLLALNERRLLDARVASLKKALSHLNEQLNHTAIAKQLKLLEEQKKTIRFQSNLLLQRLARVRTAAVEESIRQALFNFLKTHTEHNRVELNKWLLKENNLQLSRTSRFFQERSAGQQDTIEHIVNDAMAVFPEIWECHHNKQHSNHLKKAYDYQI